MAPMQCRWRFPPSPARRRQDDGRYRRAPAAGNDLQRTTAPMSSGYRRHRLASLQQRGARREDSPTRPGERHLQARLRHLVRHFPHLLARSRRRRRAGGFDRLLHNSLGRGDMAFTGRGHLDLEKGLLAASPLAVTGSDAEGQLRVLLGPAEDEADIAIDLNLAPSRGCARLRGRLCRAPVRSAAPHRHQGSENFSWSRC